MDTRIEPLYLDHAAATPMCGEAAEAMARAYLEAPANPSSMSGPGREAARVLQEARESIAESLDVNPSAVIFTSGGTEANGLAVLGSMARREGGHVVVSSIEHPSVLGSVALLERRGFAVFRVPPESDGVVDPERFVAAATDRTVLACLMHVNNELGTIQPVAEAMSGVKRKAPRCLTLVDAVQSFTRLLVVPDALRADFVSLSGHKVAGPRGIGALVARSRRPDRLVGGGEQEYGSRPGTENVPGAVGFAAAVRRQFASQGERSTRAEALREALLAGLAKDVPRARVNGDPGRSVPFIVSVSIDQLPSEALLRGLEEHGIVVSAGAACHARAQKQSHVLVALGIPRTTGTCRISFGGDSPPETVPRLVEALSATVGRYAL